MNRIALAVAISLLAGLAVGAWLSGDESQSEQSAESGSAGALTADASAEGRLLRLEQIIAEEREARIALEDTLAMLFDEIDRLEGVGDQIAVARQAAAARQAALELERQTLATERRSSRGSTDWIRDYQERRVSGLVEGGFAEDEARRILKLESEASYKAMEAAWEAERNGENVDRFAAANNPQAILRNEIGDEAYGRYLEAQGQPTAITITQVMDSSPGSSAGLQAGDELVSYNGERVFNVAELRSQTMQGNPGEDVVIEIVRNGTRMQLTVPRGPIGIAGAGANIRGSNWWGG